MRLQSRADRLSLGIVVFVTPVGLALVPQPPADVAVHFSASGTPDNYVPQFVAVLSVPVVTVATIAVLRGAARFDPPSDPHSIDALVLGVTVLFGAVHLLVVGWNLGYRAPMSVVAVGAVISTVALAGYVVFRETTA